MVRYFYAWTPLVTITVIFVLAMPWLGLIALMIVAIVVLGALAALTWAVVLVPYLLTRAISRRLHTGSGANRRAAAAPSPVGRASESVWQAPASHVPALSVSTELPAPQRTLQEGHVS